ncbi:MAG: AsmA family protein [Rhizobiaceae bacterium]|nr:AsmA family protein [Rhizobiaceae bacterium]
MKKLVTSLLVFVTIVLGIVFALPLLLSTQTMRQEFSSKISTVSGMDIELGGPVSFSVFPDLGVVARDVRLASPQGDFSVAVSKIVAGVKLTSLLSGNVEITALSLNQPKIMIDESASQENISQENTDNNQENINGDPFASAAEQLERLSLNRLSIFDGSFTSVARDGTRSEVSQINATLSAPSLDSQISLVLSAIMDGQSISIDATLAALRPILQRQPSSFELAIKLDPAPHPALSDLTASGTILLGEDGSYQISQGLFTSLEQPLRLDGLYRPGQRPYGSLSLQAERVDLGIIQRATSATDKNPNINTPETANAPVADFSTLLGFDANISINIGEFVMDNVKVRDIDVAMALNDGLLNIDLGNAKVAKGSIGAVLNADFNDEQPTIRGSLKASELGISDLAKLANTEIALTGNLAMDIAYAFRGISEKAIKDSFNMAGTVQLSNGTVVVPQLKNLVDTAGKITGIDVTANITHFQKPVDLKGKLNWNGETITLGMQVAPYQFINSNAGPLTAAISSRKFNGKFSGDINFDGAVLGRAEITTGSLGALMGWLGQGNNRDLKSFSYNGNISADSNSFAFDKATILLNDNKATGSGSVGLTGKPKITTDLSFGSLDIAALMSGGTADASANTSTAKDTPIDLSVLREFDADIKLKATRINYGKVKIGPVNTTLVIKNGVASIKLPKTSFYDGSVAANITADGSKDIAVIRIDADMSNVSALSLFDDAADFKRLEGRLNANLKINGAGKSTAIFTRSLNGSAGAKFIDGAIKGIDIAKIYNNLAAILAGGFKENENDKTTFTELGLTFAIDKGVATTNDIRLLGPLVRMDGAGNVDLGAETIDIRLNPQVVMSATGQGGEFDVGGIGIPVLIQGPLSNPKVFPDLKELLKNPQAALNSLKSIGLNFSGLKIPGLGNGSKGVVENVIGNLINNDQPANNPIGNLINNVLPGSNNNNTGPADVVNSLIGSLLNPNAGNQTPVQSNQPAAITPLVDDGEKLDITGAIPIPVRNPRRAQNTPTQPKTVQQQIVDQVVPKLDLPVSDETVNKTLNNLLNGILN